MASQSSNERVILSRLIEDRDAFEKIGNEHGSDVQEVIWQGLDLELWQHNSDLTRYLLNEARPDILAASVARNSSLLWIQPLYFFIERIGKELQPLVDWFGNQIDNLPNMTTLTIKAMPENRSFGSDFKTVSRYWTQPPTFDNTSFDFIVALQALGRTSCRVRTLNLVNIFRATDILEAQMQGLDAFQNLTTINICCGLINKESKSGLTVLGCILRSENLRNLKLCFASARRNHNAGLEPEPVLRKLFCGENWPHLHSLHLVNASAFFNLRAPERSRRLAGLRHLTLDDCTISPFVVEYLKREQLHTQLRSITIRAHTIGPQERFPKTLVDGSRVLAYLRNEVADLGPGINSETPGELVTDTEVPRCQLCSRSQKK
ncbi:hypothetical protein F4680DRAFT_452999 [Xylaria scruposa]|nr:hypothetical protein F4680DRAFT_452999 [Xylaria scruposa]